MKHHTMRHWNIFYLKCHTLKYHQHHENMNEVDFDTVSFHYVICCYGCITLYIAPGSYFIFCLYLTCVVVYIWIVVMFIWHFSYVLRLRLISTSRNLTELPMRLIDWFFVFNASFSNISAISWPPVLVVEETGIPGENHRPWASNW